MLPSSTTGNETLMESWGELNRVVSRLVEQITDSRNIKRTIRESATELQWAVQVLQQTYETRSQPVCQTASTQTLSELLAVGQEQVVTRCAGTQTGRHVGPPRGPLREDEISAVVRSDYAAGLVSESVLALFSRRWPQSVFTATTVASGSPHFFEVPGTKVVFLAADTVDEDLRGPLGDLLPELRRGRAAALLREGKTVRLAVTCSGESDEDSVVYVHGLPSTTAAGINAVTDVMEQVGERWGTGTHPNVRTISILVTVGSLLNVRRVMELRGRSRGVHYELHSCGEQTEEHGKKTPVRDGLTGRSTETITVRATGKSYAELLRTVKGNVHSGAQAPSILSIRKAGSGMEIRVQEDPARRGEFIRGLGAVQGVQASQKRRQAFVRVRDLDEEITPTEVQAGIAAASGLAPGEVIVSSLRPASGNTQIAVTKLDARVANSLVSKGRVQIGVIMCRVVSWTPEVRCYRCWGTGHTRPGCTGPERGKLCFRCGSAAHMATDCGAAAPHCLDCGGEGHRTGSRNCQGAQVNSLSPSQTTGETTFNDANEKDLENRVVAGGAAAESSV